MFLSHLSIVATLTLASSVFAQERLLNFGGIHNDINECRGSGWQNDVVTRFTGIFFGDFTTGGSQDILGGLAVKGNMHAPNYIVNANHGADCSDLSSLKSYGLVVGGTVDTFNTHVHGSAYIKGSGTIEEVMQLEEGCIVTDNQGTGIFDFPLVEEFSIASNRDYALLRPTAILTSDGELEYFNDEELALYEVINFHSCNSRICTRNPFSESVPHQILFGQGNWNGVQGSTLNPEKTYIMNIPVNNGDTIIIDTNNPALGFNPCKLVWNFFPINSRGTYLPDGEFTLIRKTSNQFGGVVLAPRGHIRDGSTGNFAGNVVGLDYTWDDLSAGVEIHDFHAAGGKCDAYDGCIPAQVTTTPLPEPTITRSTRTRSRTATWIPIITPSSSAAHDTTTVTTTEACTGRVTETETVIVDRDIVATLIETTTVTKIVVTTTGADTVTVIETATPSTVTLPVVTITETGHDLTVAGLTTTEAGLTITESGLTVTEPASTVTESGLTVTESGSTVTEECMAVTSTVFIDCEDDYQHDYHHNHHHNHHHEHDGPGGDWNEKENEDEDDCEDEDEEEENYKDEEDNDKEWKKHDDKEDHY